MTESDHRIVAATSTMSAESVLPESQKRKRTSLLAFNDDDDDDGGDEDGRASQTSKRTKNTQVT